MMITGTVSKQQFTYSSSKHHHHINVFNHSMVEEKQLIYNIKGHGDYTNALNQDMVANMISEEESSYTQAPKQHQIYDYIQKAMCDLFRNGVVDFYRLDLPPVKRIVSGELKANNFRFMNIDLLFELMDNSLLHLEFQTNHKQRDKNRFFKYDSRIRELEGFGTLHSVIIYPAKVKKSSVAFEDEVFSYHPDIIMMNTFEGKEIFKGLKKKVSNNEELSDKDMLSLSFLPLMEFDKLELDLAINSLKLADTINDLTKRELCVNSIMGFAQLYLTPEDYVILEGAFKMTSVIEQYEQEIAINNFQQGIRQGIQQGNEQKELEIAEKMLRDGREVEFILKYTTLDEGVIKQLKSRLEIQ